jgi:hypothetical protein
VGDGTGDRTGDGTGDRTGDGTGDGTGADTADRTGDGIGEGATGEGAADVDEAAGNETCGDEAGCGGLSASLLASSGATGSTSGLEAGSVNEFRGSSSARTSTPAMARADRIPAPPIRNPRSRARRALALM